MDQISGGSWYDSDGDGGMKCPECGSSDISGKAIRTVSGDWEDLKCNNCGFNWTYEP